MTSTPTSTPAPRRTDQGAATAPAFVRRSSLLVRGLLRLGVPMGPNALLTVKGRKTGEPRTAPVAIVEIDGRRWVVGAYGNVNWVRNLRASREAEVRIGGRTEHVTASELDRVEAAAFYRDVVGRYVHRMPRLGRLFLRTLFRLIGAGDLLTDPEAAAAARPVFELRPG